MQRLLSLAALFVCAAVSAQTVIDVTVPNVGVCSYTTGVVTSGATPGHLSATAVTSTGACGSSTTTNTNPPVSFGPASPLAPTTASLGNAGGPISFTFQPINANLCNATVTPSTGVTVTNPICSNAGCSASQSFSATFPSNPSTTADVPYTVKVNCSGVGSPSSPSPGGVDSLAAQVTVLHSGGGGSGPGCVTSPTIASSGGGIASFSRLTGNVNMSYYTYSHTADITSYDSIFGESPSALTWPGKSGITALVVLPTSNYVSAAFTVPAGYMAGAPANRYGQYRLNASQYTKAPVSMTISTSCGDFSNPATHPTSTVVPGCYKNKAGADSQILDWESPALGTTCALQDGTTYYMNFINADITNVTPGGGTATTTKAAAGSTCTTSCVDPIANLIFN